MTTAISRPLTLLTISLALAGNVLGQETDAETQRASLTGLRTFAVYVRVQLSDSATLPVIDESLLRVKLQSALGRDGIAVVESNDVRDGSGANLSLLYLVLETRGQTGETTGFAASSCLQAAQTVRIPRLTTAKYIAYAVVPTWRSCGLLAGGTRGYRDTILQNADEQITRFLRAWQRVNAPRPTPPSVSNPELGSLDPRPSVP
jgi:hypothetical protein